MEEVKKGYTIDLEKVISDKFKGKKLPGFVIRFLKRLLHVDWLNGFFEKGYEGIEFCEEAVKYLDFKLEVSGLENIPADGTVYTFASNHPLGGPDGIALSSLIGGKYGSLRLLVNDFLMMVPGIRPLSIPVNKVGGQVRNLPVLVREIFSSDNQILIFPAGLCSRKIDGVVQDLPWSKTFIVQSVANGRTVVPVRFDACNSKRFYRLAALRKFLKIKFNFEMITLPDEMYKARHKSFRVTFGKPIPPTFFDKSRTPLEWAAYVREEVYKL